MPPEGRSKASTIEAAGEQKRKEPGTEAAGEQKRKEPKSETVRRMERTIVWLSGTRGHIGKVCRIEWDQAAEAASGKFSTAAGQIQRQSEKKADRWMQIAGKRIPTGSRKLLTLFCMGILAGFFVMSFGKSIMLEHTEIFDEDTLYRLKYMSVDGNALFCYAFRKRMMVFLVLAVLATTYLGYVVCMGAAAWCGMSAGVFLSALFLRYGLKGLVLACVSVFPQYLFYVPAVIMMLGWSEEIYRAIYSRNRTAETWERSFILKKAGWLGVIALTILLGCMLEGYINPGLLIGYLKVF